jgi:hypothetical protein
MREVVVLTLVPPEEMRPSSQQEHSQAMDLPVPAEPGIPPLPEAVPVGMLAAVLAVANRARLLHLVSLMAVCPAALVQKVPARSLSSRRSIRLICRP